MKPRIHLINRLSSALICATAWCSTVSISQAAPPGNDDFQSAYELTGLPASAEGGNPEATRQAGEPNSPEGYGRGSLWWRWTAPSSGWVEVNTAGSSYDTMLAVYSGNALGSLTLLKFNDDALKTEQSRLRFQAVEGTEYHIQVQSWLQAVGTAKLQILASSAPQPPALQSLTLSPEVISGDGPTVAARIGISAPDGLISATVLLQRPNGGGTSTIELSLAPSEETIYSGNSTFGHPLGSGKTYFLGDWPVRLRLIDKFGDVVTYGAPGEPPLPAGSTLALKGTGADNARAPQITDIKITPEVVDITGGAKTLSLEVSANDDNGVSFFTAQLYNSEGYTMGYNEDQYRGPISGNSKEGVWKLSVDVPANLAPGSYYVQCSGFDVDFRSQYQTKKALTVVNHKVTDVTGPEIKTVSLSTARVAQTGTPAEVSIRIEVADDSALQSVGSRYGERGVSKGFSLQKISRTGNTEVWEGKLKLNGTEYPGTFPMQYSAMDAAGNATVLKNGDPKGSDLQFSPLPAGFPAFITITPGLKDAYSIWRAKYGQLAGPQGEFDADPDADGWINAVEFLCGTDPLLPSGPGKADPLGERAPVLMLSPTAIRYEYRLSMPNISAGDGTYWYLGSRTLQRVVLPYWFEDWSKPVVKDLYWAELPLNQGSGFLQLSINTSMYKTQPPYRP